MSKCSAKNRRCAGGDEWCIGGTLRIEEGGMFDLYGDKFGKETVHDTLVWDGNTDGLAYVPYYGDNFYKISDAVPRPEDLASGYTLIFSDLSGNVAEYEVVTEEALDYEKGDYHFSNQLLIVRKSESLEAKGIMDAEEGVYFRKFEDSFSAGLKIPNYTGFEKTTVYHPIPAEYLPDSAGGVYTVKITENDNGNTCNRTYEELIAAESSDAIILAKFINVDGRVFTAVHCDVAPVTSEVNFAAFDIGEYDGQKNGFSMYHIAVNTNNQVSVTIESYVSEPV